MDGAGCRATELGTRRPAAVQVCVARTLSHAPPERRSTQAKALSAISVGAGGRLNRLGVRTVFPLDRCHALSSRPYWTHGCANRRNSASKQPARHSPRPDGFVICTSAMRNIETQARYVGTSESGRPAQRARGHFGSGVAATQRLQAELRTLVQRTGIWELLVLVSDELIDRNRALARLRPAVPGRLRKLRHGDFDFALAFGGASEARVLADSQHNRQVRRPGRRRLRCRLAVGWFNCVACGAQVQTTQLLGEQRPLDGPATALVGGLLEQDSRGGWQ